MTVDELLRRVHSQPEILVNWPVCVPGPELRALLESGKPMLVSELSAHPDQRQEVRTFRYGHLVGPGLPFRQIEDWQARWPNHLLPTDLVNLVTHVDGIHLWADLDRSQAYFGILPLHEWKDAALEWADFEAPLQGQIVLSYHGNGDYYLVLNTHKSCYWWYDLENFDHPECVGYSVTDLLDWWWSEAMELDPRRYEEKL